MAVVIPGDGVVELIRCASERIIFAAPYIKTPTIIRLLENVPNRVQEFICITRWMPEDIASGVCDLEIYDEIRKVRGGCLMVHPHLHAKYYSNGQYCLVGSANLTSRGLGWRTPSNIELLVTLPANSPGLEQWENVLLSSAVVATEQLRDQIRTLAEQLIKDGNFEPAPEVGITSDETEINQLWIPKCPTPDRLWEVYQGSGEDSMVDSAYKAAKEDLTVLSPPPGLSQSVFVNYITGFLLQTLLLAEIDKLAETGLTDAKANQFLADHKVDVSTNNRAWDVVKQWLLFFFPDTYRLETSQEVVIKGRQLSAR